MDIMQVLLALFVAIVLALSGYFKDMNADEIKQELRNWNWPKFFTTILPMIIGGFVLDPSLNNSLAAVSIAGMGTLIAKNTIKGVQRSPTFKSGV